MRIWVRDGGQKATVIGSVTRETPPCSRKCVVALPSPGSSQRPRLDARCGGRVAVSPGCVC